MALLSSHPRQQRHSLLLLHSRQIASSPRPQSRPKPFTPSNTVAVDPAVKRLAKSRRFSDIEALLESRKKTRLAAHEPHLASIIVSFAYAKMLGHASRTFDQMDRLGCARTAVSLNALLTSYNHAGNHSRVPQLFRELTGKYSITPDKVSYGILIKAFCEIGAPEKASTVLKEMEERGMGVSAVAYTPILDALYRKKKVTDAEELWEEMVGRGCLPDVAAYNVRAMHYARDGTPDDVIRVIEEMELTGLVPDTISFNILITCYCKNERYPEAKNVYRRLREKNIRPNAAMYRNFMYLLCKNGDFAHAFEICREGIMNDKLPDFGPVKMLLQGLIKNSREKDARWLIQKLRKKFSPSLMKEWEKVEDQIGLSIG